MKQISTDKCYQKARSLFQLIRAGFKNIPWWRSRARIFLILEIKLKICINYWPERQWSWARRWLETIFQWCFDRAWFSQIGYKGIHVSKRYKISEFAYVNAQVFSLWLLQVDPDKSIPIWQFYIFLRRVRLYMILVKTNISWKIQELQKVKYFLLCDGEEEINFLLRAYSHQMI